MEVCATNAGDDEILVSVEDIIGDFNLPPFHVKVMPLTVVTAKVGVVLGPNGQWALDGYSITQAVEKANAILLQAGLQLEIAQPITTISYNELFWNVFTGTYEYHYLLKMIPPFGGLRVYFTNTLLDDKGVPAAGVNNPLGMMLACADDTNGIPRDVGHNLAHETGHACGLRDLFPNHSEAQLSADGAISEDRMPYDWGRYGLINNQEIPIGYFIQRLLMYWRCAGSDLPSGEVYGVWYTYETNGTNLVKNWHLSNAPVGLAGMTNVPPSHQDD